MTKILCLAKSGFGKTTSWCGREKCGIKGLTPKDTFVIQCINRSIPSDAYKLIPTVTLSKIEKGDASELAAGNRVKVCDFTGLDKYKIVAKIITLLLEKSPFKNIVIDDFNLLSQDFYLANAMKGGWETPKQIGYGMGIIFDAIDKTPENKNVICLAHYEEYKDKNGDSISYKFKTTGKMVDDYITPESRFDVILFGKQSFNSETKKPIKEYVFEYDGEYPAKDAIGLFDKMDGNSIPNDLSIIEELTKNK